VSDIERADLVVVGAGTVGGWASWFAKTSGLGRVVVLERGLAGQGASSRAAGIVRAQGGTPQTVALGRWSIDFYRRQAAGIGTDSGFRELGYLILAITAEDERVGRERVAMQRREGLAVDWLTAAEASAAIPTLAAGGHRGGSHIATDGHIDPPRNVRAYSLAMQAAGVELREGTSFTALRTEPAADGGSRVVGVETSAGPIATERVILTGGPGLREVGERAGIRIPAGAVRHTVAVLEPHAAFAVERQSMVFDIGAGLYWRLEEGGLLFGWSDPNDAPGEARSIGLGGVRRDAGAPGPVRSGDARPGPMQDLGGHDRLHARPPADPRPGPDDRGGTDRRRDGRLSGRSRDDVGSRGGPGRGGPRDPWPDRSGRRRRPRARSLRCGREQPSCRRSDRPAVPGQRRRPPRLNREPEGQIGWVVLGRPRRARLSRAPATRFARDGRATIGATRRDRLWARSCSIAIIT
jgi:glycine/D-amino acid oxidase-like deaminating enzyme